jgi:hypothetical protein
MKGIATTWHHYTLIESPEHEVYPDLPGVYLREKLADRVEVACHWTTVNTAIRAGQLTEPWYNDEHAGCPECLTQM